MAVDMDGCGEAGGRGVVAAAGTGYGGAPARARARGGRGGGGGHGGVGGGGWTGCGGGGGHLIRRRSCESHCDTSLTITRSPGLRPRTTPPAVTPARPRGTW